MRLDEAAQTLGITMSTARSRLRDVCEKTGTRRPPQHVRILMTSAARLAVE